MTDVQQIELDACRVRVDAYSAGAPFDSDRWASTDRGWLYDTRHPDRDSAWCGNLPIGNYLDYGDRVHAVVTAWRIDPITKSYFYYPTEACSFRDVASAQKWITDHYLRTRTENRR